MRTLSSAASDAGKVAGQTASHGLEKLARFGFAAKGVVYGIVGLLALQVALGTRRKTPDSTEALRSIGEQPFGQVLLALTAAGLAAYVIWRLAEAILNPEHAKAFARLGSLVSAIVNATLASVAAQAALGAMRGGGDNEITWTRSLMQQPYGPWLVGALGVVLFGVGLDHFRKAYRATFLRHYATGQMSPRQRAWAERIGQLGISARGLTFCIIGGYLVRGALRADPRDAKGLGGALRVVAEQPYGDWLLGAVALGFVAYGAHCLMRARHQRFSC